ncbi:MAG: DUF4388 domain-containing protein [Actinomycetota bacterium]
MALNGTLDSFPLGDILRFLSTAQRTGVLQIDGDRGSVRLWIEDGECTGAEAGAVMLDDAVSAAFEALRFTAGTFSFTDGGSTPLRISPRPLSVVLNDALDLRAEWDSIELVLPSSRHRVRPVATPPDGRAVLDPLGWRLVTGLGRSDDVGSVVARSGLGELEGARALVGLIREGLIVVEPPAEATAEPPEVVFEPQTPAPVSAPVPAADPFGETPDRFPIDDLYGVEAPFEPSSPPAPVAPDPSVGLSPEVASVIAEVVSSPATTEPSSTDPAFR